MRNPVQRKERSRMHTFIREEKRREGRGKGLLPYLMYVELPPSIQNYLTLHTLFHANRPTLLYYKVRYLKHYGRTGKRYRASHKVPSCRVFTHLYLLGTYTVRTVKQDTCQSIRLTTYLE